MGAFNSLFKGFDMLIELPIGQHTDLGTERPNAVSYTHLTLPTKA